VYLVGYLKRKITAIYIRSNNLKTKSNAVHYFKIHFLVSQVTQSSIQKVSQLTLFKEKAAVYFKTRTKRINKMCVGGGEQIRNFKYFNIWCV